MRIDCSTCGKHLGDISPIFRRDSNGECTKIAVTEPAKPMVCDGCLDGNPANPKKYKAGDKIWP